MTELVAALALADVNDALFWLADHWTAIGAFGFVCAWIGWSLSK